VFLTSVEMNSPAMLAGLRSGDVITAIDGEAVGNYKEFIARLLDGAAERNAQITLMRLGLNGYEEMAVEAALRPVFDESTQEEPERGRNQALD
ncbi:MAG: PDZ domain-containing protein, partial [Lachnospiraceae bacterium]|nr:PDZ domain-containing protein [Lachnospiraceae bacterium]